MRALAVTPLLLVVLAGCGTAPTEPPAGQVPGNGEIGKPGPEVAADGAAALLSGGSANVEGHLTADGADQVVSFHLQGSDMTGTVITRGQAVQIIRSHDVTYADGPSAFWQASGVPAAVAGRLAGHWVRHAGTAVQRLTPISLVWLADAVRDPSASIERRVHPGRASSGRATGVPVAVVSLAGGSTIQVAATGAPYPLVIENPGGHHGELSLSAFEESSPVAPPADATDLASGL